ncbi:flagellar biosynthesis protein FlhB [Ferrovibrio sp.]|uniref:flagellar biosynthesis protein FlhB n=1 Tax=Ferrovibrio sp. TaxID=1917215 RepID=UPI001B7A0CED|nr:flagellar biosynthesis protein FlhB [Ferrovibrio sp.]MBP7063713.1 flagellar biosynthesis protein FlhB [Ferrovibrio sp.]
MSEDADPESKTEDPTEKRLRDAEEKGNIARSQEIGHWFTFLAAIIGLWMLSDPVTRQLVASNLVFFEAPHRIDMNAPNLTRVAMDMAVSISAVLLPLLGLFALFGLIGNVVQNPPQISAERLMPKFDKINPFSGFKRIFSAASVVEFIKNIVKICVIGALLTYLILPELDSLETLVALDVSMMLSYTMRIVFKLVGAMLAIMFVVSVGDYLYQRYNYIKKLRMTKQELKDEYKESEGDPHIKARLRQLRMQRVRQRMMTAVPEASVVVTNPTHYAVALKYELGKMDAPTVTAKGADLIAKRIREIATEHEVPIVENVTLARALFLVEIDDPIPVEHYKAVAEVISYVMKLKNGGNG